jgi:YHS domain-containing protein
MRIQIVSLLFIFSSAFANAQSATGLSKIANVDGKGVILHGYDAVSYVAKGKAEKGSPRFAVLYNGVTYYFSSEENKDLFKKAPSNYEPQYGGWCAYAMGNDGSQVDFDPETFKIVNGKLYVFYNKYFNNTLKLWNKDENNLKAKADQNWATKYVSKKG